MNTRKALSWGLVVALLLFAAWFISLEMTRSPSERLFLPETEPATEPAAAPETTPEGPTASENVGSDTSGSPGGSDAIDKAAAEYVANLAKPRPEPILGEKADDFVGVDQKIRFGSEPGDDRLASAEKLVDASTPGDPLKEAAPAEPKPAPVPDTEDRAQSEVPIPVEPGSAPGSTRPTGDVTGAAVASAAVAGAAVAGAVVAGAAVAGAAVAASPRAPGVQPRSAATDPVPSDRPSEDPGTPLLATSDAKEGATPAVRGHRAMDDTVAQASDSTPHTNPSDAREGATPDVRGHRATDDTVVQTSDSPSRTNPSDAKEGTTPDVRGHRAMDDTVVQASDSPSRTNPSDAKEGTTPDVRGHRATDDTVVQASDSTPHTNPSDAKEGATPDVRGLRAPDDTVVQAGDSPTHTDPSEDSGVSAETPTAVAAQSPARSPARTIPAPPVEGTITIRELLEGIVEIDDHDVFYVHAVTFDDRQGLWGIIQKGVVENFARGMRITSRNRTNTYQVTVPHDADEVMDNLSSSPFGLMIHRKSKMTIVYNRELGQLTQDPDVTIFPGNELVIVGFKPEELIELYHYFSSLSSTDEL